VESKKTSGLLIDTK